MNTIPNLRTSKNPACHWFGLVFIALSLTLAPPIALSQEDKSIDILRQTGKAFASIAEKTSPAVVAIKTEKRITGQYPSFEGPSDGQMSPFSDDFFNYFFRRQNPSQGRTPRQRVFRQMAQGSGFIVSPKGYILTNNHLVEGVDDIKVTLTDGREFTAKTIGADPDSDVAVVKIEDDGNMPYLELADSDKIEVGEWVLAIGNPFGLSHTVTAGIVSAKGRSGMGIATYEDFIQTDAAINLGNSGGPLIDLDGKVVGINTAIIGSPTMGSAGNIGIGLAIPINMAKAVYEQIVKKGKVVYGFLGVAIQDLTPQLAESFKLKGVTGILVSDVTAGSAADKAGIKTGDVIIELDGKPLKRAADLRERVAMKGPGTQVELVILRDGKKKTLTATLQERPAGEKAEQAQTSTTEKLGLTVENLTDELAKRFGIEGLKGVIVTDVEEGTAAALAGIQPGTLIQEVNRKPVENTKEFNEEVEKAIKEGKVMLRVRYENSSMFIILTFPKE
jgi:serine protease Do